MVRSVPCTRKHPDVELQFGNVCADDISAQRYDGRAGLETPRRREGQREGFNSSSRRSPGLRSR